MNHPRHTTGAEKHGYKKADTESEKQASHELTPVSPGAGRLWCRQRLQASAILSGHCLSNHMLNKTALQKHSAQIAELGACIHISLKATKALQAGAFLCDTP
jgi:hypothetical protein